ncbi:MAG TPA: choice-of-anchor tandem repeat GloVer-containing protein [Candidatus Sulfotelmatobacter sp.]|jgi:uncharacterized repeat protein (TIGR03803 family)|nr:choice-of-anchor tandem repeat GloVer-containing protein [Candidatus Sulfotelmatobacter sp.]
MNRLTKTCLSVLAAGSVAITVHAQTGAIIPVFSFSGGTTNGAAPEGSMVLGPDGSFYGTTEGGGTNNYGTIFKITTGGALTTLVNFNGTNGDEPVGALTLGPDGNIYGTTVYGGTNFGSASTPGSLGAGSIFRLTTNGLLTTLATFVITNGENPHAGLTWGPGGLFYGTTGGGGPAGYGTIFSMTTSGTLTMLTNFNNANGNAPFAGLTVGPDGNLYGVCQSGGTHGVGTVFKVAANGMMLTNLYNFGATTTDGAFPQTTMTFGPDGNLYGVTAFTSSANNDGTIFKITTNGTLTTLINWDFYNGGEPLGSLTLGPDGAFYSTTYLGDNGNGSINKGIVYSLTTNGVFTVLAQFTGPDGAYPISGVTLGPDNNFYGVTSGGGTNNASGAVYRLGLSPIFVSNPASQSVIIGNSAAFSSQMFGTAPFGFQWRSNSVPVAGVTGGSLGVPHVFYSANNAQIQVVATNTYGSATSQVANLSVVLQPNCAAIVNNGGGNYTVTVGSYPSSMNHLWATTNLSSSWQQIAPITTDANGMGQYPDTDTADPAKFYRLSNP